MADVDDATQVYLRWCQAFQSLNVDGMKGLFDQGFDGLIYQPEEVPDPMYSWAEINAYWDAIPAIVASIPEWRELDRKVVVDGDAATVFTKLRTNILIKDAKHPLIGDLRVTLNLRRTPDGWKIAGIHESRQVELSSLFVD